MPRDAGGNYTLPAGNPVVAGTIIRPSWANPTMSDLGVEMTDSLSRSGKGGMLVPFENVDGAVNLPGITWVLEPSTGFFRDGGNDMRASVAGTVSTRWISGDLGFEIWNGTAFVKPLVDADPLIVTSLQVGAGTPSNVRTLNVISSAVAMAAFDTTADGATIDLNSTGQVVGGVGIRSQIAGTSKSFSGWREDLLAWVVSNNQTNVPWFTSNATETIFNSGGNEVGRFFATGLRMAIGMPYRGFDTATERFMMRFRTDEFTIGSAPNTARFDALTLEMNIGGANQLSFDAVGLNLGTDGRITGKKTGDIDTAMMFMQGDQIRIGGTGNPEVSIRAGTGGFFQIIVGTVETARWEGGAGAGLTMKNNIRLKGRNLADDASFDLIFTDTADRMIIGHDARLKGAIYHASDHRFLGAEGDVFHSTSRALGSLLCRDLNDVDKKMGYRNPDSVDIAGTSHTIVQGNEAQILRFTGNVVTVTVNTLNIDTIVRVVNVNGPSAVVLAKAALTTLSFLDGAPAVSVSSVSVSPGGSCEMRWVTTQLCEVTGLHITGNV